MVPKRMYVDDAVKALKEAGYNIETDEYYIYIREAAKIGVDRLRIQPSLPPYVSAKQVKVFINKKNR